MIFFLSSWFFNDNAYKGIFSSVKLCPKYIKWPSPSIFLSAESHKFILGFIWLQISSKHRQFINFVTHLKTGHPYFLLFFGCISFSFGHKWKFYQSLQSHICSRVLRLTSGILSWFSIWFNWKETSWKSNDFHCLLCLISHL